MAQKIFLAALILLVSSQAYAAPVELPKGTWLDVELLAEINAPVGGYASPTVLKITRITTDGAKSALDSSLDPSSFRLVADAIAGPDLKITIKPRKIAYRTGTGERLYLAIEGECIGTKGESKLEGIPLPEPAITNLSRTCGGGGAHSLPEFPAVISKSGRICYVQLKTGTRMRFQLTERILFEVSDNKTRVPTKDRGRL